MERDWDKLRKWIVRRRLEGIPVTAICAQAKISALACRECVKTMLVF